MTLAIGIDVGSTTIKLSYRDSVGRLVTERVAPTPGTPLEILRVVERLMTGISADLVAFSSFRRALVLNDTSMSWARDSRDFPTVQPATRGAVDAANPLAPIHRYGDRSAAAFRTFDVWLAERLTGRTLMSESQAWLSGAWDTMTQAWDPATCSAAALDLDDMPVVLRKPRVIGGLCMPILGDHEATALAAAEGGCWPLRVVECGTALACMLGGAGPLPEGLGLESPSRCGYLELIDPHHARRLEGWRGRPPEWMETTVAPTALDVVREALARGAGKQPAMLCGGNASQSLVRELAQFGFESKVMRSVTSSAGALIVAERCIRPGGA